MYKTIRHGENTGGGGKRSSSTPRKRRTSSFAYLGLIFVCTVIIGAVLIPFLVSAECLPSPTEWFLKTKAAFTHSGEKQQQQQQHQQQQQQQHIAPPPPAAPPTTTTTAPVDAVGKTVQIVNRNGVEQFILKLNKTISASRTTTTPTTTTTTTTTTTATPPAAAAAPTTTATTELLPIFSTAPPLSNRLGGTITTRIIQVPLLKSTAKKPIMPPVLAKTQSTQQQQQQQQQQLQSNNTNETQSNNSNNNNNAWMSTRWAYIPSAYGPWSGYKAEDSVLLPALLGFALIGMILIITVCLVARNKRTIVSSVRKRNRNF
ncbi:GH11982 [Drosophila grimshawi]|uniref:GH11982 n=1 Tax=Drosophila grimshawi TaxID=7222 RepID=B4JKV8_DROGR|nr:GH11982 [Drosophila grimshawi]